jgi:hypothetical protein
MATTTTEFDAGPRKVEKADPVSRDSNFFGSRRTMLNNKETDKLFPNSMSQMDAYRATRKSLSELPVTAHKERAKLEAELAANPLDAIWVVCDDEHGQYSTTVDRLDSGLVDWRRAAAKRLAKFLGEKE